MTPRTKAKAALTVATVAYAGLSLDGWLYTDTVHGHTPGDLFAGTAFAVFVALAITGQAWWPRLFPDVETGRHAAGRQP